MRPSVLSVCCIAAACGMLSGRKRKPALTCFLTIRRFLSSTFTLLTNFSTMTRSTSMTSLHTAQFESPTPSPKRPARARALTTIELDAPLRPPRSTLRLSIAPTSAEDAWSFPSTPYTPGTPVTPGTPGSPGTPSLLTPGTPTLDGLGLGLGLGFAGVARPPSAFFRTTSGGGSANGTVRGRRKPVPSYLELSDDGFAAASTAALLALPGFEMLDEPRGMPAHGNGHGYGHGQGNTHVQGHTRGADSGSSLATMTTTVSSRTGTSTHALSPPVMPAARLEARNSRASASSGASMYTTISASASRASSLSGWEYPQQKQYVLPVDPPANLTSPPPRVRPLHPRADREQATLTWFSTDVPDEPDSAWSRSLRRLRPSQWGWAWCGVHKDEDEDGDEERREAWSNWQYHSTPAATATPKAKAKTKTSSAKTDVRHLGLGVSATPRAYHWDDQRTAYPPPQPPPTFTTIPKRA